jgi:hypothetical protein
VRIELLTSPGCPHAAAAKETITDSLTALGIDVPIIDRVGSYPSPTVLVDGVDVMRPQAEAPIGDACRLDLPTPRRVLDALRANASEQRDRVLVELPPGRYIHPPDASTVAPVR